MRDLAILLAHLIATLATDTQYCATLSGAMLELRHLNAIILAQ